MHTTTLCSSCKWLLEKQCEIQLVSTRVTTALKSIILGIHYASFILIHVKKYVLNGSKDKTNLSANFEYFRKTINCNTQDAPHSEFSSFEPPCVVRSETNRHYALYSLTKNHCVQEPI